MVIATPTPAHAAVCGEIAAAFPAARILVEKSAADTLAGARHVLADIGGHQSVDVAYHMSFSPEVEWGLQVTRARAADMGTPCGIEASFADPYQDEPEAVRATYGSSWVDSRINFLSVLSRFSDVTARRSLRRLGEESWSACRGRKGTTERSINGGSLIAGRSHRPRLTCGSTRYCSSQLTTRQ
jgi:hypothetical protein